MHVIDILNHIKRVKSAMVELGGEATINLNDLTMIAKVENRKRYFYPQFTLVSDGRRAYSTEFRDDVMNFNGWYVFRNKGWEISSEKLKFKELMHRRGFRTPAHTYDPVARPRDVIIKHTTSSFGDSLRGPYREVGKHVPGTLLKEGEYYEQFVYGWIVKIWYWNEKPASLKLREMPVLKGDGTSTVRILLDRERAFLDKYYPEDWFGLQDWDFLDRLFKYQQIDMEGVLPPGLSEFLCVRLTEPSPIS